MSTIEITGQPTLTSATTAEAFDVRASELNWTIGARGDKRMWEAVYHVARVERKASDGSLVACEWTVAESPPGSLLHSAHHSVGGMLTQNFRFGMKARRG